MKKEFTLLIILIFLAFSILEILKLTQQPVQQSTLKKFSSYEEFKNFIKSNIESYGISYPSFAQPMAVTVKQAVSGIGVERASEDYSKTNIQVEGVDEPDIVKNDGKYIYVVSGKKVFIVDSYPPKNARIISEIKFNGTPQEIFVNDNQLIVFGWEEVSSTNEPKIGIIYPRYQEKTFINVYDISDKSNPILKRNISIDGNYYDSRMIGDYVYVIVNEPVYYIENEPIPLPTIKSNNILKSIPITDIYYFDFPDSSYIFTNILAINVKNDEEIAIKTFLMGYSENMYVSTNNIYIVYTKRLSEIDFYD
ncbi:MAG: beta-propeller domain-containing protein, partial [Candidatus Aenigmatarchaeota archaeon]